MAFDPLICSVCVDEGKVVVSRWSWELEGALSWERKAQILLLEDSAVKPLQSNALVLLHVGLRQEELPREAAFDVCACCGGLGSERRFLDSSEGHACSFICSTVCSETDFFFFPESGDQWGLSAKCFLPNLLRRAESSQLNEFLPK